TLEGVAELGGNVAALGVSGDGVGAGNNRPQVAQADLVGLGDSRLGSIAPLGGPQAGEELLGQGDEGLGADLRLTRALRLRLLVLGLYGLPNGGNPTLEQLLGDRNLFGRQGGDQRVAVGASGVQTLRTGSGRALLGCGCGAALSAPPRPAIASVRPRRTLALTPLRAIPAGRATTLAPTAPFVPAGDRRADEWA